MTILVTGAAGFVGTHLCQALERLPSPPALLRFDIEQSVEDLGRMLAAADFVFHFAGVNRPADPQAFRGNADLTHTICSILQERGRPVPVLLSSSTQAELDNPYGRSKRDAEEHVWAYSQATGAPVYVCRYPNLFGKWSRPNYNTVVATFCHNIARGIPVQIHDRNSSLRLLHIDDLVRDCLFLAMSPAPVSGVANERVFHAVSPIHTTTVGALYDALCAFQANRLTGLLPDLSDAFVKKLYSTWLSFLPGSEFAYPASLKEDTRGWLFELIKSPASGQVFLSKTKPGVTRGNHYHDTKIEKFCVIQGSGTIRFRRVGTTDVLEYPVSDSVIRVVDIPPGYTHSIENAGEEDMITVFWASEMFDASRPDTYFEPVINTRSSP